MIGREPPARPQGRGAHVERGLISKNGGERSFLNVEALHGRLCLLLMERSWRGPSSCWAVSVKASPSPVLSSL